MSYRLILASGSEARRELLSRLNLEFEAIAPDIDETIHPGETPEHAAERLALAKTKALALRYPEATIIGSDQIATDGKRILGKPGSARNAVAQLMDCQGRSVSFHTGWCVRTDERIESGVDRTVVHFREFDEAAAQRYVEADQPLQCAGAFKVESLGITLFRQIVATDPTGLIGLPLIDVSAALREHGIPI